MPVLALALLLSAPTVASAQERREDDRRLEEAERSMEAAKRQLEEALRNLRDQKGYAPQLNEAIRLLRESQRDWTDAARRLQIRGLNDGRGWIALAGDRPRMGVYVDTDADAARDSIGAGLSGVTPGGPAAEAGLQVGDIITRVDGESLASTSRRDRPGDKLIRIISDHEPGDTLRVEYRRDGQTRTANVVVRDTGLTGYSFGFGGGDSARVFRFEESLPRTFVQPPRIDVETPLLRFLPRGWLDMELVTLNEELGSYFGTTQGVLVVRAPEETSLNLRSGDVILDIDGREPSSPSHALRIMRSYEPGETMRIEVMRDKRRQTITATVPERDGGFFWR
jgi:S1-C subfamily serine protease